MYVIGTLIGRCGDVEGPRARREAQRAVAPRAGVQPVVDDLTRGHLALVEAARKEETGELDKAGRRMRIAATDAMGYSARTSDLVQQAGSALGVVCAASVVAAVRVCEVANAEECREVASGRGVS